MQHEDILAILGIGATAGIMTPSGVYYDPLNTIVFWEITWLGLFKIIAAFYITLLILDKLDMLEPIKKPFKTIPNKIIMLWRRVRQFIKKGG